ncbi:MAG TPA: LacI family DNA-binding transcriptional regulator [Spirochaetia bacterium]|nr:LacI family DNA-binding transcriptional regulator [Spirochaetia bacterium]
MSSKDSTNAGEKEPSALTGHTASARRIGQRDLASIFGVSTMTISRALSGRGYVDKELRIQIREAASRAGYRPHRAAQTLVRNQSITIVLVAPVWPAFFWQELGLGVEVAHNQLEHLGYSVTYLMVDFSQSEKLTESIEEIIAARPHAVGIVNMQSCKMEKVFSNFERSGIPFLTFNIDAPTTARIGYIGPDYHQDGRIAAGFVDKCVRKESSILIVAKDEPPTTFDGFSIDEARLRGIREFLEDEAQNIRSFELFHVHVDPHQGALVAVARNVVKAAAGHHAILVIPSELQEPTGNELLGEADSRRPVLVTFGNSPRVIELIRQGSVTATLSLNPIQQGYYAVVLLATFLEKGAVPKPGVFYIGPNIVIKENAGVSYDLFAQINSIF